MSLVTDFIPYIFLYIFIEVIDLNSHSFIDSLRRKFCHLLANPYQSPKHSAVSAEEEPAQLDWAFGPVAREAQPLNSGKYQSIRIL